MKSAYLKQKDYVLILLFLTNILLSGCAASRIEKSNLVQVPEINIDQHKAVGESFLVYGVSTTGLGTIMHVKKFRLTRIDNKNTEIKHGLFYSIILDEINHSSRFLLSRIIKKYGYDSIGHFTKELAMETPIFPESDFVALPIGKGRELFNLASYLASYCEEKFRKF